MRRSLALDLGRILACFGICIQHLFFMAGFNNDPYSMNQFLSHPVEGYLFYFLEFGPALFFMISGSLILPVKTSTYNFFKRKFLRILIPLIIWTTIYLIPLIYYNSPERVNLLITQAFFTSSICPTYWFLYTLIGLYLLSPILSGWLKACSRRELECYILLWVFISFFPYFSLISGIGVELNSPFYYFTGYVGFYVLGYYLRRYWEKLSTRNWLTIVLAYLIINGLLPWMEYAIGMTNVTGVYNTNIGNIVRNVAIFSTLLYFSRGKESNRWVSLIAGLTFGVYLINEMTLYWFPEFQVIPKSSPYLRLLILSAIEIIFSFTVVYLLSFLPGSKYFIGYHHK